MGTYFVTFEVTGQGYPPLRTYVDMRGKFTCSLKMRGYTGCNGPSHFIVVYVTYSGDVGTDLFVVIDHVRDVGRVAGCSCPETECSCPVELQMFRLKGFFPFGSVNCNQTRPEFVK